MADKDELIVLRKKQHIELAKDSRSQMKTHQWDDLVLPYRALPEIDLQDVSTEVKFLNKRLSQPLVIASMTGGSTHSAMINTNLAIAAEEMKVALGLGSMRVALEVPEAAESFKLARKHAPTAVILANLGAVQLNYKVTIDDCRSLIEMVEADGLYLHVNPLQEAIQPEGDTNFKGLLSKIEMLVGSLDVPVFVKEVGHGLDPKTIEKLVEIGVAGVDIAGTGGTSWAGIEALRAGNENLYMWFKEMGWDTRTILEEIDSVDILKIASGGIRSPIDGLKARALSADLYSAAQPFLAPALENPESVIKLLKDWQQGLRVVMFVCGCKDWEAAKSIELV